jgi:hypothetical protein
VVFVVLVLLIRQIKKDGRLPAEKMSTLTGVLFIPSIIIFALVFKGISSWRDDIQQQNNQIEIESFVSGVYEPLTLARQSLRNNLADMQALLREVDNMELAHPNHGDLIRHVKEQWQQGHVALYNVYKDTDKEVRRAWIAHNTMDSQDVLGKFSKQAVQIESQIKKAESTYHSHIYSVQDEMVKSLDEARKLLDANRRPPKSKKQSAANHALAENIRPFSSLASSELIAFLSSLDARLVNEVKTLQELIRLSGQQAAILRDHLYKNRDLEKPLTKIIGDWKKLEESSTASLQEILYALEAEFVARKLGLLQNNPAIQAMHKSLLLNIPAIVGKGLKQRKIIDQSYTIKRSNG